MNAVLCRLEQCAHCQQEPKGAYLAIGVGEPKTRALDLQGREVSNSVLRRAVSVSRCLRSHRFITGASSAIVPVSTGW
jgi:hypothetical protein